MGAVKHCIVLAVLGLASLAGAQTGPAAPSAAKPEQAPPAQAVVLTFSGRIERHNAAKEYPWTLAMLDALPQHHLSTLTPWAPQALQFSGPLLRDVLQAVGAQGPQLLARALNDYSVQIPAEDAWRHDVLLATRMNGQRMSVRQRGPVFVIYPFDSKPELKSSTYIERSIWQLRAIEVQ